MKSKICFLITSLFYILAASGQVNSYKLLKIYPPVNVTYPQFSLKFDYVNLSDKPGQPVIKITENGFSVNNPFLEVLPEVAAMNLYFIPFADSTLLINYLLKGTIKNNKNLSLNLMLHFDSVFFARDLSTGLKKSYHWSAVYDTTDFENLCKTKLGSYHFPSDVWIMVANDINLKLLLRISNILARNITEKPPSFILLYRKNNLKASAFKSSDFDNPKMKILQYDPSKNDLSILYNTLDPMLHMTKIIKWESPVPSSRDSLRKIQININGLESETLVSVSEDVLKNYFVSTNLKIADSLIKNEKYLDCIKKLNEWYQVKAADEFKAKTKDVLESYARHVISLKSAKPFSDYMILENASIIRLGKSYEDQKFRWAQEFYKITDYSDKLIPERLNIAEFLMKSRPDDKENKYQYHFTKAKLLEKQSNNWQAFDEYIFANSIKKDELSKKEARRLFELCFKEGYSIKDWKRIKQYGINNPEFMEETFMLRYIFGIACYNLADYPSAVTQLEWLVYNWQDNDDLKWDEAFQLLLFSYTSSFRFDKAFQLSQRIFREKKDVESLQMALLNLRLSWLKTAMDACKAWVENIPDGTNPDKILKLTRVVMPGYLGSVRFCKTAGETVSLIYENKKIAGQPSSSPPANNSNTQIIFSKNNLWIISKEANGKSLALFINNKLMDAQESSLLSGINREPNNNQFWDQLSTYEERLGIRFFTEFTSAMMESTLMLKGKMEPDKYWDAIKINKAIRYLVVHKPDGSVDFEKSFERSKASITESEWQRSSRTTAYFMTEMKYDNQNTLDITNPIFNSSGLAGTVRIGITNQ